MTPLVVPEDLTAAAVVRGPDDADLVVAGQSHTRALWSAVEAGAGPSGVAHIDRRTSSVDPASPYWDFVAAHVAGRTVVLSLGGNHHISHFLFQTDPPVRVHGPGRRAGATDGSGTWVPRSMVRAFFESRMVAALDGTLARLRASAGRLVLTGTPPPKPDDDVRAGLAAGTEASLLELVTRSGYDVATVPLTAPEDRVELWRVMQELYADTAARAGIPFVPSPVDAAGPDGLLLPECSAPDVTHANAAYGARLWRDLAPYLPGEEPR